MYVLQHTDSNSDKLVAAVVTSVFLLGTYFFLHWADLPKVQERTDMYEEINWTRFKPKPERIVAEPQQPKPAEVDKPVKVETPPAPAPKPKAVQKVDLSSLDLFKKETLAKPAKTLRTKAKSTDPVSSTRQKTRISLKSSSLLSGMNTLSGQTSQRLSLPKSGRRGRSTSNSLAIAANTGSELSLGSGRDYGSAANFLGAPKTKSVAGSAPQVEMVDMARMGREFENLSPIYTALLAWMRQHPADLPRVVARFMERSPGDLTAAVQFQIDGRAFQLFILCKTNLYEVRVCLLEGNTSTYLIDRGFKEKSSYLRVGKVNRTPRGQILSFGTTRKEAANARAQAFYQIFLSWWENVKHEVQ